MSVSALMASPLCQGLFAQAMGSSGSVMGFKKVLTLKEAEQKGVEMAQKIAAQMVGKTDKTKGKASKKKAPKADIDMLRNLPAEELLKLASVKSLPVYNIDGYFFVEQPEVTFAKGNQTKGDDNSDNGKRAVRLSACACCPTSMWNSRGRCQKPSLHPVAPAHPCW